ncbi:MAG TPA: DsbA family protein, partial [Hyphomicrobiaceae bacterium]
MNFANAIEALRSRKGVALLVPAVALVWTALAIGRSEPISIPVARAETAPSATAPSGAAPAVSAERRQEIEAIIKHYLTNNPEILMEMQTALEAKMDKIQAERTAVVIKSNASEIFHPAFSGVVNPKGEVPVLEFFDYNCGYCRRALSDVTKLVEKEKQVRLILKELP